MSEKSNLFIDIQGEEKGSSIIFSHGLSGSARNWRGQVSVFKSRYKVVSYDLRGHARSNAPLDEACYTAEALVGDVLRVMEHSKAEKPILCGLSLGAAVSLQAALRHPDKFKGLVLASYPSSKMVPNSIRKIAKQFAQSIREEGLDRAGEKYVWGSESGLTENDAKFVRMGFLEHQGHGIANILSAFLEPLPEIEEFTAQLKLLNLPTLVIAGSKDIPCIMTAQVLTRYLPNVEIVIIQDAGHLVNIEAREKFNEKLSAFMQKILPCDS